ncbi:MAG: tetraacyldisaccharide 4'-kinase, partial [Bacteroidales bacterium]|nr:tetraacyldisaccharide 4'-kinase [Bacteroidales bacterium]
LLQEQYSVAILSRGYKRTTKGFLLANEESTIQKIGDEPLQYIKKFKKIKVAVDEKRTRGIKKLIKKFPDIDVILLDDAFQHRYVKPGLSILLTDFHKLYVNDYPIPSGNLREFRSGAKRADIIIITKTLKVLSPITRRRLTGLIKPKKHQELYFSYIEHGIFTPLPGIEFTPQKEKYNTILLITGIANPYPLEAFLKRNCEELVMLNYPDHHQFTLKDIDKIIETYNDIFSKNKIIITTEKDAMRLLKPEFFNTIKDLPFCYIPIEIKLHKEDEIKFNEQIIKYVKKNRKNT